MYNWIWVLNISDGSEQQHSVPNAFKTLENKGFLRNEGLNTLEAVQMFYKAICEEPMKPKCEEIDLLEFCKTDPSSYGDYQPVVTIQLKEGCQTESILFFNIKGASRLNQVTNCSETSTSKLN